MQTPLFHGEAVCKDGLASLYRGWEAVGGHLYLTNQRLIFESHSLNFQTGTTAIPLSCIYSVDLAYSILLGIPILPNSILVTTIDGFQFRMMVYHRDLWVQAILQQKSQLEAAPAMEAKVL